MICVITWYLMSLLGKCMNSLVRSSIRWETGQATSHWVSRSASCMLEIFHWLLNSLVQQFNPSKLWMNNPFALRSVSFLHIQALNWSYAIGQLQQEELGCLHQNDSSVEQQGGGLGDVLAVNQTGKGLDFARVALTTVVWYHCMAFSSISPARTVPSCKNYEVSVVWKTEKASSYTL